MWGLLAWLTFGEHAAPVQPTLAWHAPRGCPTLPDIERRIGTHLGGDFKQPRPEPFDGRAEVTTSRSGYQLSLTLIAGDGETHEVHGMATCHEVAELTALKIALTLDPDAFVAHLGQSPQEEPSTKTETLVPTQVALDPVALQVDTRAAAKPKPALFLGAAGGVDAFFLPQPTAVVSLQVGLAGRKWTAEARGLFLFPSSARLRMPADVGAEILSGTATIGGCFAPQLGRFGLSTCTGVEAGALRARGHGTTSQRVATRPYVGAVLGLVAAVRLGRWRIFARPETAIALSRPFFAIEGTETADTRVVFRTPPLTFRAFVGVEVTFSDKR